MFEVRDKPKMVQRALLVGVYFDKSDEALATSLLEELHELVTTLGIGIVESMLVKVRGKENAGFLTGTGKMEEIVEHAKGLDCDCIIFDNELSPSQQRNWEREGDVTVIDRQEVILDIFAMRAQTKEARLQVDLARMQYSLPRLARMWAHLDRQGGSGAAAARGEGEKQIEIDRRLARKRIDRVKSELAEVRKQRETQRKDRMRTPVPHAAIVGYTNAGKSSLLNRLADADVLAEDKLFATLDTTTRRITLPDGQALLLTDTVGFVRRLPHGLVEAFKATLEEAVLADFLIHVLDASAADVYDHYQTTKDVLKELGADEKKTIVVLNKIDKIENDRVRLHELETHFTGAFFVSVKSGEGLEALYHKCGEMLLDRVARLSLRIPQARADLVSMLHREGKVLSEDYEGNDVLVTAMLPRRLVAQVRQFEENESEIKAEDPKKKLVDPESAGQRL
ncbi:MAG: GTPase HflX [Verrucomicrobiota bacterium]